MSGIKTNELQKLPNILGTDTILVDAASAGTARVPFNKAAEFFHKALQEKGLSADNIFLADGETSLSTALSNKADKGPPTWYDLPLNTAKFSFGFARYCKDQFGIVHVSISCPTINRGTVPDGTLIGTLPDGFRPTIDVHCVYYDTNTPRLVRTSFMKNGTIVGYGCDGNGFSNVNLEMSFAFFV